MLPCLFAFLRALTSREIPGFGGNFEAKYDDNGVTGERDQILTEIFDYVRTVNLNETYKTRNASLSGGNFVSYTNDRVSGNIGTDAAFKQASGSGWVLPIKTPYGRGAGRVPVISEIGLWFIQTRTESGGAFSDPSPPEVQPGFLIETFSPMQGVMGWVPLNFSYKITNITAPTINGQNLVPNTEFRSTWTPPGSAFARSINMGGTDGFAWLMSGGLSTANINHFGDVPHLTSKANAIKLPPGSTTFDIVGGEIEITFMTSPNYDTRGGGTVFQTYRVQIPSATGIPVPTPVDPNLALAGAAYKPVLLNGWAQRRGNPTVASLIKFSPGDDVVRGLAIRHGDYRTVAYLENVPTSFFQKDWQANFGFRTRGTLAYPGTRNGSYVSGLAYTSAQSADATNFYETPRPKIPLDINGLVEALWDADFDNGLANLIDGPYLNKTDEGSLSATGQVPYFFERGALADGLFSPFRQIPSAVAFGSLPTGVKHAEAGQNTYWRTLAFSPNPLSGSAHHGLSDPPDHLLLDLFTMPIVEPYAISEPFSTAGRLNLNHQLAPFSHITRTTALQAALASQKVVALNDSLASTYKTANYPASSIRFPIDATETLEAMDDYLKEKGQNLFRSASEICGVHLVPQGQTAQSVKTWWNNYRLTGNNSRERPYASLYPLLTTKSNVFTTHLRAQAIKRLPSGEIKVLAEYRGSILFERYLDFNDEAFQTGTVDPDNVSLEPYFKFRTLSSKQFDP